MRGNFLYNSGSCEGVLLNENKLHSKCWIFSGIDGIGSSLQGWDEGWTCLSASLDKNQSVWKRSQLSWDEYWAIWCMKVLMKCRNTQTHTHTPTQRPCHFLPLPLPLHLLPLVLSYKQRQTHTAGVSPNGKPSIEHSLFLSLPLSLSHTHADTHTLCGGHLHWVTYDWTLLQPSPSLSHPCRDLIMIFHTCARQTHARTQTHTHTRTRTQLSL